MVFATRVFMILVVMTALLAGCQNMPASKKTSTNAVDKTEQIEREYDSTVFEGVAKELANGKDLPAKEIEAFAAAPETRADFYRMLYEFHKTDIFPARYYNFEKASESALVEWLMYPTELDTIPSKIELVKKVDLLENDSTFTYYVYRFRTEKPHWAAKDGWMFGVVGPYFSDSAPYDWSKGTFSRFNKIGETTPEEEVNWTHQNIFRTNDR